MNSFGKAFLFVLTIDLVGLGFYLLGSLSGFYPDNEKKFIACGILIFLGGIALDRFINSLLPYVR